MPTLEEVSLGIEKQEMKEATDNTFPVLSDQEDIKESLTQRAYERKFSQQFYAQFIKKALIYRRDIRSMIVSLILPVVIIVVSYALVSESGIVSKRNETNTR